MKLNNYWIIMVLLVIAVPVLTACGSDTATAKEIKPAYLEAIEGSEFKRVVLTERAAERLDIQTAPVTEGEDGMIVPYAAVIYGVHGETWVYTNPAPLSFERQAITIESIEGGNAFVSAGPEPGTMVVTVGVPELYGEETGIKK